MRVQRLWGAAVLAVAVGLSGCAADSPTDIEAALSAELTSDVSAVADAAAAGDYVGAIALLDAVTGKVNGAASEGRITGSRLVTLQQSISTVRVDLETLLAAAATPTPEPTQSEQTVVETPVEEAPVEEAPAQEAPAEKEPKDEKGPGKENSGTGPGDNSGPGKDKKK